MDQGTLVAIGAIAAVAIVAMLMRGMKGGDDAVSTPVPEDSVSEGAAPAPEAPEGGPADDEEDSGEVVAVTSDGYGFLPDTHAVRLVPPDEEGESWKSGESARHRRGAAAIATSWHAGDFTGARVTHGGVDAPWRLEALGRDGEYTVFDFETKEGADAALGLFESRGVIRVGTDDDGNPMPPSPEQFAEARRVYDETYQALAMEQDADEEDRP